MSNLLKKGSTITKSERVIDYNEKIKEKLQAVIDAESAAGDQSSDGFVNGLTADVVERLTQDDDANEETSATQEELENQELEQLEQARQKEMTQREEVQREDIQKENRRKGTEEKNKNIAGRNREETEVDSGKNCKVIAIHNKTEDAAVAEREAKMQQFEDIMGRIVGKALREQAENLGDAMGNHLCNKMLREVDELMVEQEQREEERYKRLDETIRSVQKARQEVAVSKDGTRKKSLFFRKNKRKL